MNAIRSVEAGNPVKNGSKRSPAALGKPLSAGERVGILMTPAAHGGHLGNVGYGFGSQVKMDLLMSLNTWLRSLTAPGLVPIRKAEFRVGALARGDRSLSVESLEDRVVPVASIAINNPSIVEGNTGSANLKFTVTRSGDDTLSAITVGYNTSDNSPAAGAATAGTDYTAKNSTITIPSGSTTATINIPVAGDTLVEPNEQLFVNLTGVTNVTGPATTFAAKTDFTAGAKAISVVTGDLNGDGKLDLAIANYNENTVSVMLNTTAPGATTPSYSVKTDFGTGTTPRSLALGDLNGDGKPDLAIVNQNSNTVSVLLNTTTSGATTPTFAAKTDFTTGTQPLSVAIGDLNGDGKPDLAVANDLSYTVSVLRNTMAAGATTATFDTKSDFATGTNPIFVAIGDVNGDGKSDLAIANLGADSVSVLLNTTISGSTTLSYSTKTDFTTGSLPYSVAIGDLNGDGKSDFAVANRSSNTVSVFLNTTDPGAATPTYDHKIDFATSKTPNSVAIGDLNNDGKPDLAVTCSDTSANVYSVSILRNTTTPGAETPTFTAKTDFTAGTGANGVAIGDLNGDGKLDLAIANLMSNTVSVLLSTTISPAPAVALGGGSFNTGANPMSVAVGDLNGDGKPDLAIANSDSNTVSVLLNTTAPGATTPTYGTKTDFATGLSPSSVALGDLNGDGQLDLAITNANSNTVSVLLNTTAPGATTPTYSTTTDFATGLSPSSIAIGDLNGDGQLDLAITNANSNTVSVLLNTTAPGATTPTYSTTTDFATGLSPSSIAIGDLNGDGKADLVVANQNSNTVSVFRNTTATGDTTATFAARTDFATGVGPVSVAVGNLNGDGKPDLAIVNFSSSTVSVLLNTTVTGATTIAYTTSSDFTTGTQPSSVVIGDMNGDGKPDLAVADKGINSASVILNTTAPGATTPTYATRADFAIGTSPQSVAIGDLNGDGKPDLAVANLGSNSVSVLLNKLAVIGTNQGTGTITNDDYPPISVAVNSGTVSANEGSMVANAGTFSDVFGNSTATISASVGIVAQDNVNGTWSWSISEADGPVGPVTVTITATDTHSSIATTIFTYTVDNVAPTLAWSGPSSGLRGEILSFTLSPTDVGTADQAGTFTYNIDWNGDGLNDQTITGPAGKVVTHTFAAAGNFNVGIKAIDKDGGTSASVAHSVHIDSWRLQPNPSNSSLTDLLWSGTAGKDSASFEVSGLNQITVHTTLLNGIVTSTTEVFNGVTGGIIVYGQQGADLLDASTVAGHSLELRGNGGNDTILGSNSADLIYGDSDGGEGGADSIVAGNGDDVVYADGSEGGADTVSGGIGDDQIFGDPIQGAEGSNDVIDGGDDNDLIDTGFGNDIVTGGSGNDVLIGGNNTDSLTGGAGEDLIIAAGLATSFYATGGLGLQQLWSQWRTSDPVNTRISYLTGTPGGIISPAFVLSPGSTLLDDGAIDTVIADDDTDEDWIIANLPQDVIHQTIDDIFTDL